MKLEKWIYLNHLGHNQPDFGGSPIRLRVISHDQFADYSKPRYGFFVCQLSVMFRDESKPLGHDEQFTVQWEQDESSIPPEQFGRALQELGRSLEGLK